MTLIVGTPHWKGVCLNADTRVTNKNSKSYKDDVIKISHIHGGIGTASSGNALGAIAINESIRKSLDDYQQSGQRFDKSVDLIPIIQKILIDGLKMTRNHQSIENPLKIYDVKNAGLIGVNIPDQKLILNTEECNNLIEILVSGSTLNSIYSKNIEAIGRCANGYCKEITLEDFNYNLLFRYYVKLFDDESSDIYELEKVPFGKIVALGTGSEFEYIRESPRILSFVLFSHEGEDIYNASLHLTAMQEQAEINVKMDPDYNFKTFGGGIVPAVITSDDKNGRTEVVISELINKKDNKLASETFIKNNDLWIRTREGKEYKLRKPNEAKNLSELLYSN